MANKKIPAGVKLDREGFPYRIDDGLEFRVTRCCYAPVSCDENGTIYCKKCYKAVSAVFALDPRTEAA